MENKLKSTLYQSNETWEQGIYSVNASEHSFLNSIEGGESPFDYTAFDISGKGGIP